jgi:hypothetical protein
MIKVTIITILLVSGLANAETYTINGKQGSTKLQALVALAQNKDAKVERCKFTEDQDSNKGSVKCKPVELSPRGTIRIQK